jgi:hypothetical protein
MNSTVEGQSVDLSAYPELVVIYLGMRVTRLRGVMSILRIGRQLGGIVGAYTDGLLRHEPLVYGLTHLGMRQYWRDLESLERFTRSDRHRVWWREFLRDSGGTGFWHETYRMRGGMEAIYIDMPQPIGFGAFAASRAPEGAFLGARGRLAA